MSSANGRRQPAGEFDFLVAPAFLPVLFSRTGKNARATKQKTPAG
jgi:hypothetical protein